MRSVDVEEIASAVVGSLAGTDPGLLGCGAVSSPEDYTCTGYYACSGDLGVAYDCGGAATFNCSPEFICYPNDAQFSCPPIVGATFGSCDQVYSCGSYAAP
jgi:hypothetical protein